MIFAALDTSTITSFALMIDGELVLNEQLNISGRNSDQELVPWVITLLQKHNLKISQVERWVLGTGPGSFSGLRAGIAFIKGVAVASGAIYQGMPSSLALANSVANQLKDGELCAVINDGRRNQIIFSRYQKSGIGMIIEKEHCVLNPDKFMVNMESCKLLLTPQPDAIKKLVPESQQMKLITCNGVEAKYLLKNTQLNTETSELSCEPVYVRPAVFVKPKAIKIFS